MKRGISGYTVVRNALELDYPVHLTIQSLLVGCNEVVVGLADSTDGTTEMLEEWARRETRLRLIRQPWPDPTADVKWFTRWINQTREHLLYDTQLMLDADELIESGCFDVLRAYPPGTSLTMHRLNYWRNSKHLIPHGRCCSHLVTRFGPTPLWMPSDEIYGGHDFPGPEPIIRQKAKVNDRLVIHHLGFLRKREALFAKCRVVLKAFFGGYDSRLEEAERHPEKAWQDFCQFDLPLLNCDGSGLEMAKEWLEERKAL